MIRSIFVMIMVLQSVFLVVSLGVLIYLAVVPRVHQDSARAIIIDRQALPPEHDRTVLQPKRVADESTDSTP